MQAVAAPSGRDCKEILTFLTHGDTSDSFRSSQSTSWQIPSSSKRRQRPYIPVRGSVQRCQQSPRERHPPAARGPAISAIASPAAVASQQTALCSGSSCGASPGAWLGRGLRRACSDVTQHWTDTSFMHTKSREAKSSTTFVTTTAEEAIKISLERLQA